MDFLALTHAGVLLGAIRNDLHVVSVHIVAEEIIEVSLGPLTSKHIEAAVSLEEEMNLSFVEIVWCQVVSDHPCRLTVWKSMQCPMRD